MGKKCAAKRDLHFAAIFNTLQGCFENGSEETKKDIPHMCKVWSQLNLF